MSGHEIVDSGTGLECVLDGQGVRDDPGALPAIGISEAALIGINPIPQPEIIKVTDGMVSGADPQELRPARCKVALYKQPVERFEELAGECVPFAATLPGSTVQRLQLREEG